MIGLGSFGGIVAIAHIERDLVQRDKIISFEEFSDGLVLAQMISGSTGTSLIISLGYASFGVGLNYLDWVRIQWISCLSGGFGFGDISNLGLCYFKQIGWLYFEDSKMIAGRSIKNPLGAKGLIQDDFSAMFVSNRRDRAA